MASYGIYHSASGKFVSNYIRHLNGRYEIQLANDIQDTRIWAKKESAELQLKNLLNDPDDDSLEVREVSMTVPKWNVYEDESDD